MNTSQINCFIEAAKRLNFTEASNALHISQPALSRNISGLEEELGIELFSRSNKQKETRLTPAGAILLESFESLGEQFENALEKARNIHEGKQGTIYVGLVETERIDNKILLMADAFSDKYPNVGLYYRRGSYKELVNWLQDGTLDVAFTLRIDIEENENFLYEDIYQTESLLFVSKKHPLAGKKNLSFIDFKDDTFITVAASESEALHYLLIDECAKAGFTPKVEVADTVKEQILLLESGKGVAIGGENNMVLLEPHISSVHLSDLHPIKISLVWNRENYNPTIALFCSTNEETQV